MGPEIGGLNPGTLSIGDLRIPVVSGSDLRFPAAAKWERLTIGVGEGARREVASEDPITEIALGRDEEVGGSVKEVEDDNCSFGFVGGKTESMILRRIFLASSAMELMPAPPPTSS